MPIVSFSSRELSELLVHFNRSQVQLPSNKSCRLIGGMECCDSTLILTFGTTRTAELPVLRTNRTINPQVPWYSFLVEAEWTSGLLNSDGWNRPFENSQGPYRESNPEPPFLWRSASTNCVTVLYHSKILDLPT